MRPLFGEDHLSLGEVAISMLMTSPCLEETFKLIEPLETPRVILCSGFF